MALPSTVGAFGERTGLVSAKTAGAIVAGLSAIALFMGRVAAIRTFSCQV